MSAKDEGVLLKTAGFIPGPNCCLVMGNYVVYRPGDTRSGKFELIHQTPTRATYFPPSTEKGVLAQVKTHQKARP